MKHQIKCYGNTCPDRFKCALYATEAEEGKTEPDEVPVKKCEFFRKKADVVEVKDENIPSFRKIIGGSEWG